MLEDFYLEGRSSHINCKADDVFHDRHMNQTLHEVASFSSMVCGVVKTGLTGNV